LPVSSKYSNSTSKGNDFYSIEPQANFSRKQLSVLMRIVLNFLVYRVKSKQATMFRKWKAGTQQTVRPVKKTVAFAIQGETPNKR
jgi:hypothetical protein